jgi:signal transduction histidine kinase
VWDKTQMMQALINLMENSIDSIGNDGEIKMIINENGRIVEIVFKDSGRGIPPENIDKIFNLYFTTKPNGSGIGLSIVQKIISEHGGSISVKNEDGGGAVFTIQLPKNLPRSSQ